MTDSTPRMLLLAELQKLTRLPDDALFRLLREGKVRCQLSPKGEILVDPASVSSDTLAASLVAPVTTLLQQHDAVIRERLRDVLHAEFDQIVQDVVKTLLNHHPELARTDQATQDTGSAAPADEGAAS